METDFMRNLTLKIYLFIYLKSATEGLESNLYAKMYTIQRMHLWAYAIHNFTLYHCSLPICCVNIRSKSWQVSWSCWPCSFAYSVLEHTPSSALMTMSIHRLSPDSLRNHGCSFSDIARWKSLQVF